MAEQSGNGRIPLEEYANEILQDLPQLFKQYPAGIFTAQLQDFYGEPITRTLNACRKLASNGNVQLRRTAAGAYCMLPVGVKMLPVWELSPLQLRLATLIRNICIREKTRYLKSNFSQLARQLNCSYGGVRACVFRLHELEYIVIKQPSKRGKQDMMLIQVLDKLLAQNLDS